MSRSGRVDIKTFRLIMGKFRDTTTGIPAVKGLFKPVNAVIGLEPSWLNLENYIAMRKYVDGMWQLLKEASAEPTKCTELVPGGPLYMEFVDASGEDSGGVWMGGKFDL